MQEHALQIADPKVRRMCLLSACPRATSHSCDSFRPFNTSCTSRDTTFRRASSQGRCLGNSRAPVSLLLSVRRTSFGWGIVRKSMIGCRAEPCASAEDHESRIHGRSAQVLPAHVSRVRTKGLRAICSLTLRCGLNVDMSRRLVAQPEVAGLAPERPGCWEEVQRSGLAHAVHLGHHW